MRVYVFDSNQAPVWVSPFVLDQPFPNRRPETEARVSFVFVRTDRRQVSLVLVEYQVDFFVYRLHRCHTVGVDEFCLVMIGAHQFGVDGFHFFDSV